LVNVFGDCHTLWFLKTSLEILWKSRCSVALQKARSVSPYPTQRTCICVGGVDFASFTSFLLNCRIDRRVWYYCFSFYSYMGTRSAIMLNTACICKIVIVITLITRNWDISKFIWKFQVLPHNIVESGIKFHNLNQYTLLKKTPWFPKCLHRVISLYLWKKDLVSLYSIYLWIIYLQDIKMRYCMESLNTAIFLIL